jgi:hypothetical protein
VRERRVKDWRTVNTLTDILVHREHTDGQIGAAWKLTAGAAQGDLTDRLLQFERRLQGPHEET